MAAKYREFLVGKWSYYVMEKNLYQFVYKMVATVQNYVEKKMRSNTSCPWLIGL